MKPNQRGTGTQTFEGVQVLRALAAFLVLVTHATSYASTGIPGAGFWGLGARGVDVFFVISGFVMTMSSERLVGREGAWRVFAQNRIIRIVPLYWVATGWKTIVSLASSGLVRHGQFSTWNVVSSFFFIPSFNSEGIVHPFLGVGWTLNFEMFFYAFFALGLALRVRAWLFSAVIFVAIGALSYTPLRTGGVLDFYLNDIVLDFVMGIVWAKLTRRGFSLPPLVAAVCLVAGLIYLPTTSFTGVPHAIQGGLPSLLIVMATTSLEPKFTGRVPHWLLFLGAASYALYLFHPLVGPAGPRIVTKLGMPNELASVLVTIALALIVSSLIHLYVEVPMTRFFKPRQSKRVERELGRGTVPL